MITSYHMNLESKPTGGRWSGGEVIKCYKNATQTAATAASYCCRYSRVSGEQCNSSMSDISISTLIYYPIAKDELSIPYEWMDMNIVRDQNFSPRGRGLM